MKKIQNFKKFSIKENTGFDSNPPVHDDDGSGRLKTSVGPATPLQNEYIDQIKNWTESKKIDPAFEDEILLRIAIKNKKNDLVKYLLPKLPKTFKSDDASRDLRVNSFLIGTAYEYKNPEAANILMDYLKPSSEVLNRVIHWIKHSMKYTDKAQMEYDINEVEERISQL